MADNASNGGDEGLAGRSKLIEAIYRVALEPNGYDDFMEHWDQHIAGATGKLEELQKSSDGEGSEPDLANHFTIGFRLLEEMGRGSPATFFGNQDDVSKRARFLLDLQGRVAWYNGAAGRQFGLERQSHINSLPLDDHGRDLLARMLKRLGETPEPSVPPAVVRLDAENGQTSVFMTARAIHDRDGQSMVLLEDSAHVWPAGMDSLLSDAFRFSPTEVDITRSLIEGQDATEIAAARGSAVATVRTQIKKLLSKTSAKSQVELVRLITALIPVAARDRSDEDADGVTLGRFWISGRSMPVFRFGPPKGRPVIFIHGMLDGCGMPEALIDGLHRENLLMVAPVRPCFGEAADDGGPIETAPQRFASDLAELCDQLDLSGCILLGHMAGSVYAFAAAAELGARALGILNVSGGVPILSNAQFNVISRRQRLVAYTAKYAPSVLPFILRAGIRQLDYGGESSFMQALYETAPIDMETLSDPEAHELVKDGYHFTVAQGYRGFEIDSYHVVRNWTGLVEATQQPVTLVHGIHDQVVDIASVRNFSDRYADRVTLVEAPESGQLVFYRQPDLIITAISDFFDRLA